MQKSINDQLEALKLDNRRLNKYVQKQQIQKQNKQYATFRKHRPQKTKTVHFAKDTNSKIDRNDTVHKIGNTPSSKTEEENSQF